MKVAILTPAFYQAVEEIDGEYSAIFDRDCFENGVATKKSNYKSVVGDRLLGVEELIKIPVRGETRIVCKIMLSEPDRC